jgi:hypothetical protein
MNVNFKMRGNVELERKLRELPYGYKRVALEAFTDYIIGNESHGLKWYPAKQGQKYERTYNLREAWTVHDTQGGYRPVITNEMPYAAAVPEVWGAGGWINYGWRKWIDVIASNMAGALRHAQAQVNAWIKSNG